MMVFRRYECVGDRPDRRQRDSGRGDDDIEALLAQVAPGLQRALVASFGREIGSEVTVDALAWAWTRQRRTLALSNPGGYLYKVGTSFARRSIRRSARQRDHDQFAVITDRTVPIGSEPRLTHWHTCRPSSAARSCWSTATASHWPTQLRASAVRSRRSAITWTAA